MHDAPGDETSEFFALILVTMKQEKAHSNCNAITATRKNVAGYVTHAAASKFNSKKKRPWPIELTTKIEALFQMIHFIFVNACLFIHVVKNFVMEAHTDWTNKAKKPSRAIFVMLKIPTDPRCSTNRILRSRSTFLRIWTTFCRSSSHSRSFSCVLIKKEG